MEGDRTETEHESLERRLDRYYADKEAHAHKRMGSRKANWERSGTSLKGWMAKFSASLDLPFKSIATFVGSWMILEVGWPLLIVFGVATAGSVWSIPTTIPCLFIAMYGTVLVSGTNVVRSLIVQLGNGRDNLVKALFRGYFGSLLSIAVVLIVHAYFRSHMPQLFWLPIVYLLPIDGSVLGTGGTVPIPIPIGISGLYMDLLVTIIVYAVGVTGSCIGSIEILQYLLNASRKHGSYGAILGVLVLAVFPAMNIYFSLVFLTSTLDLFGRCISLGV